MDKNNKINSVSFFILKFLIEYLFCPDNRVVKNNKTLLSSYYKKCSNVYFKLLYMIFFVNWSCLSIAR
ncbi:MAG: hypothetical protein C0591_14035 [Marinilabiliales bacterium]|nr:MAG: hypothetical protein C0591_14035 [Marinilabiliales bacterium]